MARYQFFQTKLIEPEPIQHYIKSLARNFTKIVELRTKLANYSYDKGLLVRHEAQCFQFLTHMFNCTFSSFGSENEYKVPIPLDNDKTKKTFDLLFHTKDTKQSYLKNGQKGLLSLRDSGVFSEFFEWELGNSLNHKCSIFKFRDDLFDEFVQLIIHSKGSYRTKIEDLIRDNYARNTINKPNIEISQIHNSRVKNPSAQLYKQRTKSQVPLIIDFGNAEAFLKTFLKDMDKLKKAVIIQDYKEFLVKTLEKGRVISGSTLKDLKVELYLTYFTDKHGRVYDDFGWVNLKSELKDALTPDFINIDLKSCYVNINAQLFKNNGQYCSFYKSDERKYLHKILGLKKLGLSTKEAKPLLKTTNLRFQFSNSKVNEQSKLMKTIQEFPQLNTEEFKKFYIETLETDHRFKSLKRNQRKYWSSVIEQAKANNNICVSPRGLSYDISDLSKLDQHKKVAVHTLQGIEANLIDVLILGLNQKILDKILDLPKRTPLHIVEELLDQNKGLNLKWATIEHDGLRIPKSESKQLDKLMKKLKNRVSISSINLELEVKNKPVTEVEVRPTSKPTNRTKLQNTTRLNNTQHNNQQYQQIYIEPVGSPNNKLISYIKPVKEKSGEFNKIRGLSNGTPLRTNNSRYRRNNSLNFYCERSKFTVNARMNADTEQDYTNLRCKYITYFSQHKQSLGAYNGHIH